MSSPSTNAAEYRGAPRLSWKKRVAFSLVAVVLVFGALEVTARGYYFVRNLRAPPPAPVQAAPAPSPTPAIPTPSPTPDPARLHPYTYYEDDGQYYLKPGYDDGAIHINAKGFRGREFDANKTTGVARIMVIGDSTVFGLAGEQCPFPAQLETMLNQAGSGPHVEVINAGVEGYDSVWCVHAMQRKDWLQYRPDLVVIKVGWNDFYSSDIRQNRSPDWMGRVVSSSAFLTAIRNLWFEKIHPLTGIAAPTQIISDDDIRAFTPHGFVENVRTMIEQSRARGASVLLVNQPTLLDERMSPAALQLMKYPYFTTSPKQMLLLYQRYDAALRGLALEENVPLADVSHAFDGLDKTKYFLDVLHVTCDGNTLIAKALLPSVRTAVAKVAR